MNLLPFRGGSLITRMPLYKPRSLTIQYLIGANVAFYAFYLLSTGPKRLMYRKSFVIEEDSGIQSVLLAHIGHTSIGYLAFNSAILYTIGNYHVVKYGSSHFLKLYALGCLAGGILAA